MTVGKVYAALMIFDFYKQNKTTRDQIHQAPGGLSQVPVPGFQEVIPRLWTLQMFGSRGTRPSRRKYTMRRK